MSAVVPADPFGMSPWWQDPFLGGPQTAISDGCGLLPDAGELADLGAARLRHVRCMAADAVDHLIALMDAIDASTVDMEEDTEDASPEEIHGEGDPLEDAEDGGDDEPSLGAPEDHACQIGWARGWDDDREMEVAHA